MENQMKLIMKIHIILNILEVILELQLQDNINLVFPLMIKLPSIFQIQVYQQIELS
jgi:hypothetical protein